MTPRLLIIEDHVTFSELIEKKLREHRIFGPAVEIRSHLGILADWPPTHELRQYSMVFVDAYAGEPQQKDPRESIYLGLDILERLQQIKDDQIRHGLEHGLCPVTVYSTNMSHPAVNIPAREYDVVSSCIGTEELLDNIGRLLEGGKVEPDALVPPPSPSDYEALGVGPNARVAKAYHTMRERSDAWELVWRPDFDTKSRSGMPGEPKVREFINDTIRPLLDITVNNYKPAVEVMRKVAGLPR